MMLNHKILKELYRVQLLDRKSNITIVDASLNIDLLRVRTKSTEVDLLSSLDAMHAKKEVFVSWEQNIVTITQEGIVSLNTKKYYHEYIKHRRGKILFYIKIVGLIATFLTIIISTFIIIGYFTSK